MAIRITFLLFLIVGFWSHLSAQSDQLKIDDFRTSGTALTIGDRCFRLVPDMEYLSGSIWHKKPIDLNAPFEMEIRLMLGCKDADGADGMVFIFHPSAQRTGRWGEGMGFGGLRPSLGIEIDTWLNDHLGDPYEDHMALLVDGQMHHALDLVGPIRIPNVEDCKQHLLRITWSPTAIQLNVALDGKRYISYRGNIIQNVFQGNSSVYWGISSGTGRYSNRHDVCLEKIRYVSADEPSDFDPKLVRQLLDGEIMSLKELQFTTGSAELDPESFAELNKLYNLLRRNPEHTIEIFGHTDSSGDADTNRMLSQGRAKAISNYLVKRGISPNRIITRGYGESYPIATNGTPEGRRLNRRVDIHLYIAIP